MTLTERIGKAWSTLTESSPRQEKALTPNQYYGPDSPGGGGGMILNGSKSRGGLGPASSFFGLDHLALRDRSRRVRWESTEAEKLVTRLVENVIGTGLSVQSSPIWELLEPSSKRKAKPAPMPGQEPEEDADSERRHMIKRDIEVRHNLYLNSTEPDSTRTRSGYNLQNFEASCLFWDGEVFKVYRYSDDPRRMSPLYFQFYLPEQVIQPTNASEIEAAKARGNCICEGIELTPEGEEVAIYVVTDVSGWGIGGQSQIEALYGANYSTKTTRIPFFGESGRRFVSHPKLTDLPGQVRGVPLLANVIHELMKITDGTVAELEALVLNALFAVWIKPSDKVGSSMPTGVGRPTGSSVSGNSSTHVDDQGNTTFLRPGIMFPKLKPGESLESFDSARPNLNVTEFMSRIAGGVAAAKGMAPEFANLKFDTAYTAARAAVLATWVKVEIWRDIIDVQSVGLEFRAWFIEEFNAKRIKAPGFGKSGILTEAWLNHKLLGSSMPSLDPLKEANAVSLRTELGHTTGEAEAMKYNGSDFTENVARQKVENEDLAEARAPLNLQAPSQGSLFAPDGMDMPQGDDPNAPNYEPKMDPNAPEYDPNYTPEADSGSSLGPGLSSSDTMKAETDSYGVAVRAGAITPQVEDEDHFRKKAGLPPMSADAKASWAKDSNVRRPITLTPPAGTAKAGGFGNSAPAPASEDPNPEDTGAP